MLVISLEQYRSHLLHMKSRWVTPMASSVRFDAHVQFSKSQALKVMKYPVHQDVRWVYEPTLQEGPGAVVSTGTLLTETINEEDLDDHPLSIEPDDLFLVEQLQVSDDEETSDDTSELKYNPKDLSLTWQAPVTILFFCSISSR